MLVPPLLNFLAKHPVVDKLDLSSVRLLVVGAAPVAPALFTDCLARFAAKGHPVKIISAFGLTESSQSLLRANTVYIVTSATQAGPWRILHCPKITWKNTALSALFYPIWREVSWTRTAKTLQKAPRASSGFADPA